MAARLLLIIIIIFSRPLSAGRINHSEVEYHNGIYSLSFDVEIDRELEGVRTIVTDYAGLHRISELLVESDIISAPEDQPLQRLLVVRTCILIFCRKIRMVEEIIEKDGDVYETTVIPDQSDFRSGNTSWRLTGMKEQRTRIELDSEQEPDFWIPPIIGPIMVKHRLKREALFIIENIEKWQVND